MKRMTSGKKSFAPRPWLESLEKGAVIALRNECSAGKPRIMQTVTIISVTKRVILTKLGKFSRSMGYALDGTSIDYWVIDKELTEQRRSLKLVDEVA